MLVKLREYLDIKRGPSLSSKYYSQKGNFVRLTLGNFNYPNGGFKENTSKDDIYYIGKVKKEYILNKNDLITPLTEQTLGLLGETAFIPEDNKYIQSGDIGLVLPYKEKLNDKYCYYLLSSPLIKKQLSDGAQQTKIRHTSPEKIKDSLAFIPNIKTQEKIGNLLFSIDCQITRNNAMVKRLQVLTQAIYNYWFIQYKIPNFKSDLIYNKNLNRKIPLNWKVKKISEVCNIILGGTPSTKIAEYWKGDINWLNSGEIAHFPITKSELKISNLGLKNSATKLMKKGTILVSITGNIRVSILAIDSCANQSVVGIEENDVFEAGYLYPCVKNLIELYEKTSTGNCQKHINKNAIEHSYLLIPPYDILQKYSEYIRPFYKKIYDISLLNEKLLLLKNTLLPLLINQQLT